MFVDFEDNQELNVSSQFFSGTDKSTDSKEPGVVFPLACNDSVKNMLNVSSIIDHRHSNVLCKYTEARIANADTEKKVVDYKETKVLSLEYDFSKSPFDNLLEKDSKMIYQGANKITPLLKDKLTNVLNALYSNENPFDAIMVIDKSNIEEKHYSSFTGRTYNGNTLWDLDDTPFTRNDKPEETLTKDSYEVIDKFVFAYENYMKDLANRSKVKEIKDSVDCGIENYYSTFDYDKMLCAKLWGKDIQKMKNSKEYKEFFKNDYFKTQLATELMDIVQAYEADFRWGETI